MKCSCYICLLLYGIPFTIIYGLLSHTQVNKWNTSQNFLRTHLKIAYKTNNTLERLLTQQHNKHHYTNQNKFQKSGVYQLVCKDCSKKYIGQTGRSFHTRSKEHFRDYKYNNGKSNFAQHLIDNNHTFGTMEEIMKIVYITKKGRLIYTLERFHIYVETRRNNQINDKNTVHQNIIFDTILHASADRGHLAH